MADATDTELIGVTVPIDWVRKIDLWVKKNPMSNRQDFIRNAIKEKLESRA